jgi:hypothetical protein
MEDTEPLNSQISPVLSFPGDFCQEISHLLELGLDHENLIRHPLSVGKWVQINPNLAFSQALSPLEKTKISLSSALVL